VDSLLSNNKQKRWHYESRVKAEESFALKLETGRVPDPNNSEDFFACTLVVENHSRIATAEDLINRLFVVQSRRPSSDTATHLSPENFGFDDLRLYVKWKDDPALRPTKLSGMVFEVQVKTFLQHAWGIATHDFVYKSDDVDWAESRIAFQVKAMLEHAELSIGEASRLSEAKLLGRCDRVNLELKETIQAIRDRWQPDQLPTDLKRLAENILNLSQSLELKLDELWRVVDEASKNGNGAKLLNLSPYAATLDALFNAKGKALFDALAKSHRKSSIFVPDEIAIPDMRPDVMKKIVRPVKTAVVVPASSTPSA
jgi:ppGpp synthetase/RelA/SpoT-type nucleotidyltranferase